jgi:LmbE family N-acetylglucosaminyl deacetylase
MDKKNKKVNASQPENSALKHLKKIVAKPYFGVAYVTLALLILFISVVFWATLSAKIQSANSDQLINSYLFSHPSSLGSAIFPGSHSMLLKWPLFWLISLFGISDSNLVAFTAATVLLTVAILVAILYRIEHRPLIFGTICLALASCLMLVPTQPHAGNLLPVNMAMLATRNLEYVLYIACIFLFVRSPKIRSRQFWLAVILMSVLIASDKLFLTLSLGGALLALVFYALFNGWNLVSMSVRLVIASLGAGLGGLLILWWFNFQKITHIAGKSDAGPYGLVHSLHDLVLGLIYAFLGTLTNFGANPASNTTVLRNIPHDAASNLLGISGLSFLANLAILMAGVVAAWHLIKNSLAYNKKKGISLANSSRLSIMLLWASLAAIIAFSVTSHYYAADARYITIALFAIFISIASYTSKSKWQPATIAMAAPFLILAIVLAIPTVVRSYDTGQAAQASNSDRDALVAQVLQHHHADILVGDYWRVVPTKLASNNKLNILPLENCTQPRSILTSQNWQLNLTKHSFAYLLSFDGNLTNYPTCKLDDIIKVYGRPNSSVLIAGRLSQPKEVLLYYDHGIHSSVPVTSSRPADTVLPVGLDELSHTSCSVPTTMNIVAHQDDDLLFMNPDILRRIKAGHCIRSVYITAGDAGAGKLYWLGREQGSEAAYSTMLGIDDIWIERIIKLGDHQFITVANPKGNSNISLIFLHLPDGNLKGQGFGASNFESLAKLGSGAIKQIHAVDNQSYYNADDLVAALTALMHTYQPAEIKTQANHISSVYPDHSDHMAVGNFVKQAHSQYEDKQFDNRVNIPLDFYIGYPVHERAANVSGDDLSQKETLFAAYSKFDHRVCQSAQRCMKDPAYGAYLPRQYKLEY